MGDVRREAGDGISKFQRFSFSAFQSGRQLLVIGYWLLVIGYWLLVIGYRLSVVSYPLSDICRQLSVISHQLSVISYRGRLSGNGCRLSVRPGRQIK